MAFLVPVALRAATPQPDVYVLGCDGDLHRLALGAKAADVMVPLSAKTHLVVKGNDSGGTFSGCATQGAAPLPGTGDFVTLAQTAGDADADGNFSYRLLRFHLPEGSFRGELALPGSYSEAPSLNLAADGTVHVIAKDRDFALHGTTWQQTAFADGLPLPARNWAILDLHGYKAVGPGAEHLPPTVHFLRLQHSGGVVLVQLIEPGVASDYALIQPGAHRFVLLNRAFSSAPNAVWLAPGGGAVLLGETRLVKPSSQAVRQTGRLALVRGSDGTVLRTWQEPLLAGHSLAGITPGGLIAISLGEHYRLRPVGQTFPRTAVWCDSTSCATALFTAP